MDPQVATILHLLNEMDAENMPNERRAEILVGAMMKPTPEDMQWAREALVEIRQQEGK